MKTLVPVKRAVDWNVKMSMNPFGEVFGVADYGFVGDLFTLVPGLADAC